MYVCFCVPVDVEKQISLNVQVLFGVRGLGGTYFMYACIAVHLKESLYACIAVHLKNLL